jgi:hypothetical protein
MQVNYNYNWQECIGEPGGLVQRNLWSYLESEQLTPQTKTYDSFTGTWFDNGRWGNNAYVSGNFDTITENTASFGGYNIAFGENDYLYWTSRYPQGQAPPTFEGQCIFIQWQSSATYTSSVSLFGGGASFWGGSNTVLGNTGLYIGWPAMANQTTQTNPLVDLTTNSGMYLGGIVADGTPVGNGSNIFAYNVGVGMNVSGSQFAISPGVFNGTGPLYIKNNSLAGGFDFTNNDLTFGQQGTFPPTGWVGPDGSNITYAFKGAVKRILVYNSVLSGNEIAQNWRYLQTLP